ncbi:MAG TPA: thiamine pyrophosphate-dependent enzyme, partial [Symbiobacteriaceae bacterium]|nr:thiamine pyrophosphate-dependent enzyme [Symbiobacteriaceae bacterium]
RAEIEEWRQRDPIPRFRAYLVEQAGVPSAEVDAEEAKARRNMEAAVQFAEASPNPDLTDLLSDIYAD